METHLISVDLDFLLDTRLATLHRIDPEAARKAFANPAYFNRASDIFDDIAGVDRVTFDEAYAKRDVETLYYSRICESILSLASIVFGLERERLQTPFIESVSVELNLYPYVLTPDQAEQFELAVAARLPLDVKVSSAFIPPEEMTPVKIKANYSGLLMYGFAGWFKLHGQRLEETKLTTVTVVAPKLHVNDKEHFKPGAMGEEFAHVDPYEAIEGFMSPYIGLNWVDARTVSILRPEVVAAENAKLEEEARKKAQRDTDGA